MIGTTNPVAGGSRQSDNPQTDSFAEKLWAGLTGSPVGQLFKSVWGWIRTSNVGVAARRGLMPYRAVAATTPAHLLAVWAVWAVSFVVLAFLTSPWPILLRVPIVVGWVFGGLGLILASSLGYYHYRLSAAQLRHSLLGRAGVAHYLEIKRNLGPGVAQFRANVIRPYTATQRTLEPSDVAMKLGVSRTVEVWMLAEYAMYLVGPARSGKGFGILISAIVEAPGAVVSTSTRVDNMEATIALRAAKGPVFLFDPENVSSRQNTVRWSPIPGCEDPQVAQRRAQTLVGRTGINKGDNSVWAGSAGEIVQALLHAAAVAGKTVDDVYEWSRSPAYARPAIEILQDRGYTEENWAGTIEAVQNDDPRLAGSKWFAVSAAFAPLAVTKVRNIFNVAADDPARFDPQRFLLESGTLYMVSRWRETEATSSVGGFFSLLLDDIAEAARKISQDPKYAGRLDPPATMVLDEIANIHPWAALPRAMTAGSGEGLQVLVAFQSRSQARDSYGDENERVMWESAARLILGGGADKSDMDALSDILGKDEKVSVNHSTNPGQGLFDRNTQESRSLAAILDSDDLRRFPERMALLVAGRTRPVVMDLIPWIERDWANWAKWSKAWHQAHPAEVGGRAPVLDRDSFTEFYYNNTTPDSAVPNLPSAQNVQEKESSREP